MFNYNDVEDELDDRRPVFEGGLYDDAPTAPGQTPTILKREKTFAPATQTSTKKSILFQSRRKFYTQGTQLSLFDVAEQE